MLLTLYEDTSFSTFFSSVLNLKELNQWYFPSDIALFCLSVMIVLLMMRIIPLWFNDNAMIKLEVFSYCLPLLVRFSSYPPHCSFLQLLEMIDVEDSLRKYWLSLTFSDFCPLTNNFQIMTNMTNLQSFDTILRLRKNPSNSLLLVWDSSFP